MTAIGMYGSRYNNTWFFYNLMFSSLEAITSVYWERQLRKQFCDQVSFVTFDETHLVRTWGKHVLVSAIEFADSAEHAYSKITDFCLTKETCYAIFVHLWKMCPLTSDIGLGIYHASMSEA